MKIRFLVLVFFGLIVFQKLYAQKRGVKFCFPEVTFQGKRTDSNLQDYLLFKVCNSKGKQVIGVVVSYSEYTMTKDKISGRSLANKEICRVKTNIQHNSEKTLKVYLPYNFYGYDVNDVVISKFIFSDGTSISVTTLNQG